MASDVPILPEKLTPSEVRARIMSIMKEKNYDPFMKLIELATDTQDVIVDGKMLRCPICDVDQQILIAKELAQYIAPKLKGIELRAEVDAEYTFKVQQFAEQPKEDRMVSRIAEDARQMLVDEETKAKVAEISKSALTLPLTIVEEATKLEEGGSDA